MPRRSTRSRRLTATSKALHAANIAAPYRHARLAAVRLEGNTNALVGFKPDATVEELKVELAKRVAAMRDAGMVDLAALPPPENSATAAQSIGAQ